jgi:hypothetical protein
MRQVVYDLQIFQGVVERIAIAMMNLLIRQ